MSSHREAPEISKDPVADSTDLYAFVSPDRPDTVTLIANYIPLQSPAGGPNFYEFGDDVLYEIHITTTATASPTSRSSSASTPSSPTPDSFLYNTGPITSLNPELEQQAVLHGDPRSTSTATGCSPATWPARRATSASRRPRTMSTTWARGRAHTRQRHQGLRRTARRAVLRRPRLDLRPRRPAPVPARSTRSARWPSGAARRQRDQPPERAHDRHPDPDLAAGLPGRHTIGVWTLGRAPAGQDPPTSGRRLQHQRPVRAGLAARATRCSTRSSCPSGTRTGGTGSRRSTTSSSRTYVAHPELAGCCRSCTRACSRTWPR